MTKQTIIKRGGIGICSDGILIANLSTCVALCLYHPLLKIGGLTHIFGSRKYHDSPSKKYIKPEEEGYFYADNAVPEMLKRMKSSFPEIENRSLKSVITGGMHNEGPIQEVLDELGLKEVSGTTDGRTLLRTVHESKYKFKLAGYNINNGMHRNVRFNVGSREITIIETAPYAGTTNTTTVIRL